MKIPYVKMHGCGGDYIYFDCLRTPVPNASSLAHHLLGHHAELDSDGLVMITPSSEADARMQLFRPDGSVGRLNGDAVHGAGKFLFEHTCLSKQDLVLEGDGNLHKLGLAVLDDEVESVCLNMGRADLSATQIPVGLGLSTVIDEPVIIGGSEERITCVSVGGPFCVVFRDNVSDLNLEQLGPCFEHDPIFPQGTSVVFVRVIGWNALRIRVWERGFGETGSGGAASCAAAVAAIVRGFCGKEQDVVVKLPDGELTVQYHANGVVTLTGSTKTLRAGAVDL